MAGSIASLTVSLGLDAAEFTSGLTKADREAQKFADRQKRNRLAIDNQIKGLEKQAQLLGLSAREAKLFELAQKGATDAQLKSADAALKQAEAYEQATNIGRLVAAAAVAAGAGLVLLTKGSLDAADEIGKLSQKTGIATETLSAYQYAASLSDVTNEALAGGLTRLAKSMSEAAQGSKEQAQAFDAIGVSVKNADGSLRATDQVLADIAERFSRYADGPEKAALAQAIFGRSGADLIPILNLGAKGLDQMRQEAERLGLVVGGDLAKNAEEFNDALTRIGTGAQALGLSIARELLPTLQAVADEFLKARERGESFSLIGQAIKTAFDTVVVVGANVAFVLQGIGREAAALAAQIGVLSGDTETFAGSVTRALGPLGALLSLLDTGKRAQFTAISDAVREDAQRARAELDAFERRVLLGVSSSGKRLDASTDPRSLTFGKPLAGTPPKPPAPRLGGNDTKISKTQSEAQRYLESLQKQLEGTKNLTVAETVLADIQSGRLKLSSGVTQQQLLGIAQQIDAAKRLESQRKAEAQQMEDFLAAQKEAAAEQQRARDAAAQATARDADARARETQELIEGNQALRDEIQIVLGGEEARRAIEQARLSSAIALKEDTLAMLENAGASQQEIQAIQQQIGLLKERAGLLGKRNAADDIARQAEEQFRFVQSIGDAVASNFERAVLEGGKLKDLLGGIEQDILRIVTRKLVTEPLADFITGSLGGGLGGGGIGSFIGGLFGGGRAIGGPVLPSRMYEVNERGPELLEDARGRQFLMMGSERARVIPNERIAAGRSMSVVNQFTIAGAVDRRTEEHIAAASGRGLSRAMLRGTA